MITQMDDIIKVKKKSGKPFKSGLKVNTVVSTIVNKKDPKRRVAYIFKEDNSIVNCDLCNIIEK